MISIEIDALLNEDSQLFLLFTLTLMALVCFWLVFYYLKHARLIEDTPTSKIRSAAQGYVEIMGTVSMASNHLLSAPLSGTACVWFTYKIQQYRRTGKSSHWSTIEEKTSTEQFLIKDDTGTCVINPEGAEVQTTYSRTWYGHTKKPVQAKKSINFFNIIIGKRYRYIEKIIQADDILYALGDFKTNGGGRNVPGIHQMTGIVIREWRHNYKLILKHFDRDKNGVIDMTEWEEVRTAARQEAEKRRQKLTQLPTVFSLGNTTKKQQPFILSTLGQQKLVKKYRLFAILSLIGLSLFTVLAFTQTQAIQLSNI
ncbi:E3 Ubiquitin ligase [Nitrosomonas marina]|uniref:RING-type E3 ubiquitin transferase n=1 Tax=Nitrosomonas marina TaxID=917 RepID=A0A1I0CJV1_9PROT|nr:GIDE domain-containing protein [Nitrosomonas marina]SET19835.1 E3 Ubiquitin ligase [Nitrosomonas marina]